MAIDLETILYSGDIDLIYSKRMRVESLKANAGELADVNVADNGDLVDSPLPVPGWETSSSSTQAFDIAAFQIWYKIDTLQNITPEDILANDSISGLGGIWLQEFGHNGGGIIGFGLGINDAQPTTTLETVFLPQSFAGRFTVYTQMYASTDMPAGTKIDMWIRVDSRETVNFNAWLAGGLGTHTIKISKASQPGLILDIDQDGNADKVITIITSDSDSINIDSDGDSVADTIIPKGP